MLERQLTRPADGVMAGTRIGYSRGVVVPDPPVGAWHRPHGHEGSCSNHGLFGRIVLNPYAG